MPDITTTTTGRHKHHHTCQIYLSDFYTLSLFFLFHSIYNLVNIDLLNILCFVDS